MSRLRPRLPLRLRRLAHALRGPAESLMRIPTVRRAVWTVMRVPFDPFDPAVRDDPYPFYRSLRERDPVHFTRFGCWLITGYAEAVAVLRDTRFGHPDYPALSGPRPTPLAHFRDRIPIAKNPPEHTRLRSAITEALTPATMEARRSHIEAQADRLLDRVEAGRRMDVVEDLAHPLAIGTMAGLLGVPAEDLGRLRPWVRSLADILADFAPSRARIEEGDTAVALLRAYFDDLLAERRRAPQPDVMSVLVQAEQHERLDAEELASVCILVFAAGYETTVGLIGNGVLALLRHPSEISRLREDPGLIRSAVEEFLRYDTPVQSFGRLALDDVALGGKLIRRGQQIFVLTAAANRDPTRFPDPDRLDITRKDNHHLGFGAGIHACLGQHLARVESQIAIGKLVRRLGRMELAAPPTRYDGLHGRALKSLPIVF